MAKLDLPIRAFVEDFASRAFPNRTYARGTASNDLVIKPMAAILQPLRHEIDAIKINQSMANYRYMVTEDLDALAANWGAFRQTGGRAYGTVRLFFDTLSDYQLNYLQFISDDGVTFQLTGPVTIAANALLQNQSSGGITTYSYDVNVASVGIGSRYAVAANTITRAINPPTHLVRVTNPEAFTVTAPNESNYDVVNRLYRDLGLKNLVSRSSIRSPIFDTFPGVLDVLVAGSTHAKMLRDLQTVLLPDNTVTTLHLGGKTDIWLNTINTSTYVQSVGYLPSSKMIRLVSADQAAIQEAAYTFTKALVTVDAEYSAASSSVVPDESMSLQALQAGVPTVAAIVGSPSSQGLSRIAASDVTRGTSTFNLGHPADITVPAPYIADYENGNFKDIGVLPGDMVYLGGTSYAAVSKVSQSVLELKPGVSAEVVTLNTALSYGLSEINISLSTAPTLRSLASYVNGRFVVTTGEAQGFYQVLYTTNATNFVIGNILSEATLSGATFVSVDPLGGNLYDFNVAAGIIDARTDTTCRVYISTPSGLPATAGTNIYAVRSVNRGSSFTLRLSVPSGSPSVGSISVTIVQGLRGTLTGTDKISLEVDADVGPVQSDVRTLAQRQTKYANSLDYAWDTEPKPALTWNNTGTSVLFQLSKVHSFSVNQLLSVTATGGTGWTAIVRISSVPSTTSVGVTYLTAPTGSPSAVTVRCDVIEAPGIQTATAANDVLLIDSSVATFVPGSDGGGSGPYASFVALPALSGTNYINRLKVGGDVSAVFPSGTPYAIQKNTSALASFTGAVSTVGAVSQIVCPAALGAGVGDGAKLIAYLPGTGESAVVTTSSASNARTLTFVPGKTAQVLTFSTGYTTALAGSIGSTIVQTSGSATVTGTLVEIDNSAQTWTITLDNVGAPFVAAVNASIVGAVGGGVVSSVAAFANGPSGATDKFGYWPPVGGDVGSTVRQGTYTGTLVSFDSTTWRVKPTTSADLFDSLTAPTFIDNGVYPGFPVVTGNVRKSCTLQVPASAPSLVGGAPTLTLDRVLTAGSQTVNLFPRFPSTGALFAGSTFLVSAQSFNAGIFATTQPSSGTTNPAGILTNIGANLGTFDIGSVGATSMSLLTPGTTELVRIINAGSATTSALTVSASAGATTLNISGQGWGYWSAVGRVLVLTVNGSTYYLETNGPGGTADDINLIAPLPFALASGTTVTAEIVNGFVTPYFVPQRNTQLAYRITRPPLIGSDVVPASGVLAQTGGAYTAATSVFQGTATDFSVALLGADMADYWLHLDSGTDASPTPLKITGFSGTSTFTVATPFTHTVTNVAYHISRRPTKQTKETWVPASVAGWVSTTLILDVLDFDPTTLFTNNTYGLYTAILEKMDVPGTSIGSYLVVSATSTTVTLFASAGFISGWDTHTLRVSFRVTDRSQARTISGSLLNTFDYFAGGYMTLPIVRIQKVEVLDAATGQTLRSVGFTQLVNDAGLRYSANEDTSLFVNDDTAIYQPLRITYSADASIGAVDDYLNDTNIRVENANQMAKRMETLLINATITVRSSNTASSISAQLAQYINTRPSTQAISKDGIIQYLYQNNLVTGIDTSTFVLSGTYYTIDGSLVAYTDAATIFGADTACYVAGTISVVVT